MAHDHVAEQRRTRARIVAVNGGVESAIRSGALGPIIDTTLAEAIVLGLLRQGIGRFFTVLGHGSTELGEVLRIYANEGLVRVRAVRNEIEAAHAATALRWVTGEKAAVVTSIGPGALQAMAGSLAAASDGIGVWHLYGDETTHDEGPNMQQIPKQEQELFLRLGQTMGAAYTLHTPHAIGTAMRRGQAAVDDPHFAGPFYLFMPLNTQPAPLPGFHLDELPTAKPPAPMREATDQAAYDEAVAAIRAAKRVVVKIGAGARFAGDEIAAFLDRAHAVAVLSPRSTGAIPDAHPRNMHVGGSKGSISGNFAMEEADLLIALGTRAVCQSDCSRTAYPKVVHVININTNPRDAAHYARTTALVGEVSATLRVLNICLSAEPIAADRERAFWLTECAEKREEWHAFKQARYDHPTLEDPVWGRAVLTQPAVIKAVTDLARVRDLITFFDAGDVQANGFQIVEDDRPGRTFTETGASYMGFAVSALLATAVDEDMPYAVALTGDGSFSMNPQILIDGVAHGARGCVVLLDNRRMAAISALQQAQYGVDFATNDFVAVDYVAWASAVEGVKAVFGGYDLASLTAALETAFAHPGLSLVHVPVYYGPDPLGGLGAFGRWNVGNWVDDTQRLRHKIGL